VSSFQKGSMSGPDHYRIAEVLLANLRDEMAGHPGTLLRTPEQQAQMIAEAQVHATLALVASSLTPRAIGPEQSWGGRHWTVLGDEWDVVA
jgi:hypothetical protein